jgi:hypothetical protein
MDDLDKRQEASWTSTVEVYIRICYTKILDIDTINQRFQADAIIESIWFDPNIKSLNDTLNEKQMWKPDLYIENGVKDVKEELSYQIVPYTPNEWIKLDDDNKEPKFLICEMRKVTGIFFENLELEDFPLDVQDLTIKVATKKPGNIVKFVRMQKDFERVFTSHTLDKTMWKMSDILLTKPTNVQRSFSYGPRTYPAIKLSAKVFRLPGFFYWNALLPQLLISLASLAPFAVDIKIPQGRLPITCTLMMTSVSLRWTIGRLLPTVSYLTSLDKYSLGAMIIITMELIYHAIMGHVFPSLYLELGYLLDKAALIFFASLVFTKQIIFWIWVIVCSRRRSKIRKGELVGLNKDNHGHKRFVESMPFIERI